MFKDSEFYKSIVLGFKNYINFSGRASRGNYWFWILFCCILIFGIDLIFLLLPFLFFLSSPFAENTLTLLRIIIDLLLMIPSISINVRRLHDINEGGFIVYLVYIRTVFWFLAIAGLGYTFSPGSYNDLNAVFFLGMLLIVIVLEIVNICWCCQKGDLTPNRFGPPPLIKNYMTDSIPR